MVRSWAAGGRESLFVLGDLMQAIAIRFFLALIIVASLEIVDRYLFTQSGPRGRVGIFPHFLQRLWPDLAHLGFEPTIVASSLSTFVQVAGVFLGLYFAAVSLVVGAYASSGAPGSVRELLVTRISRNGYIDLIAFFGAASTLLMAEMAIGLEPGTPNLLLVVILAISSVFGFVILGVRTFGYLSPANLATSLPGELFQWIDAATPTGHRWNDPSFQRYYQQRAVRLLTVFNEVFDYSVAENRASTDAVSSLATATIRLEQWYVAKKYRIPTESHWFERVGKHQSWLTASEDEVMFLLSIGWRSEPQPVQELLWFEQRLETVVETALRLLAIERRIDNAVSVMEVGRDALEVMARSFAIVEALRLSATMERSAESLFGSADVKLSDLSENREHARLVLALREGSCMGLTRIVLGLTRAIEAMSLDEFHHSIASIVWNRPETLYASRMPRPVIEQIELLADRLGFERDIEGRTITPVWYQEQFVGRAFIAFVQTSVANLIGHLEEKFGSTTKGYLAEGRHLFALQLVERGFETCHKFEILIAEAKACDERMATLRRIPEEPWPESNWEAESVRVTSVRRQLIQALGQCAPALISAEKHSEEWPDFFGYVHRVLASECASALIEGDEDLFAALFPPYFNSCLAAHDRLTEEMSNAPNPWKTFHVTEPVADLLHLSGLAQIYSELEGTQFWDAAKVIWDTWLNANPEQDKMMAWLILTIRARDRAFMISPYQGIRSNWQRPLEQRLHDQGLLTDDFGDPFVEYQEQQVTHESPVIRALGGNSWGLQCDPQDVFVVTYLRRRPGGETLELTSDQAFYEKKIQREETGTSPTYGEDD